MATAAFIAARRALLAELLAAHVSWRDGVINPAIAKLNAAKPKDPGLQPLADLLTASVLKINLYRPELDRLIAETMAMVPDDPPPPPPPVGTLPLWRRGQKVGEWRELPGTAMETCPTGYPPGNFGPGKVFSKLNTWNGLSIDTRTSVVWSVGNGGHNDYHGNEVDKLPLGNDSPRWIEMLQASPKEAVTSDSAYYSDGKPASVHSYYSQQFIESKNKAVRMGSLSVAKSGMPHPEVAGYDIITNKYDPAGTYPDLPFAPTAGLGTCKNALTDEVYVFNNNYNAYKWSPVTNVFTKVNTEYPGVRMNGACDFDTKRNRILMIRGSGNTSHTFDPATGKFTAHTLTGDVAAINAAVGGIGMIYEPVLDAYLVRLGKAGGPAVYEINPETFAVSALATTGGEAIPVAYTGGNFLTTENVYTKFLYAPKLGGVVYFAQYSANAWFLVTHADGAEPPPPPPPPPDDVVTTELQTRSRPCGTGFTGQRTEQRTVTTTNGVPDNPPWIETSNTCVAIPPPPPVEDKGEPFLAFSDLTSGPKSGNTDTSKGQTLGQDGAIVSVWGNRLGNSQGASTIWINGAQCRVYYWGPAVKPWSPANLVNELQNMQVIIAQVSGNAQDGPGSIQVIVGGLTSNALPFRVRPGRIFYWALSGNDAGDGTWQHPMLTLNTTKVNAKANQPGDIIYVCDGIKQLTYGTSECCLQLKANGSDEMPMSLIGYPGASVQIGTPGIDKDTARNPIWFYNGGGVPVHNWTIAKLIVGGGVEALNFKPHCHMIGCDFTCAHFWDSNTGALSGGCHGTRLLGNEFHHVGFGRTSLYHLVYWSGGRDSQVPIADFMEGYEIAWNFFHDIIANRATNTYNQAEPGGFSPHIGNGKMHHNAFVDCCGAAVGFLTMTAGHNWAWSNVMLRCGGENPTFPTGGEYYVNYAGAFCGSGYMKVGPGGQLVRDAARKHECVNHFWFNTMIDCGHWFDKTDLKQKPKWNYAGAWALHHHAYHDSDLRNNVTVQTNGVAYFTPRDAPMSQVDAQLSHNAWFGMPDAPAFEINSITSDPKLVGYRPGPGSPLIASGTPILDAPFELRDFDGRLISNSAPDRGALKPKS